MTTEAAQTLGKYAIAVLTLAGCFLLLYTQNVTDTQPWTVIGLIVGWIVRDSAGSSAAANAARTIAAASPATQPA